MAESLEERIRARLGELTPLRVDFEDQSAQHAGHAGARAGAHVRLEIVSARFSGLPRTARHRLVYASLADLMPGAIHALTMNLLAPDE